MTKKEPKEIKIIVRKGKTKDGREFPVFKLVEENGKLVDLHFRKDVEISKFEKLNKFKVKAEYVQLAENYEFPRYYVGNVDYSTIVDLYSE